MKVSVVTPNYNGLKFLNSYFETLLIQSRFIEEIIIIDNASTDGSIEFIEEFISSANYPIDIILIKNEDNLGFAPAVNQGIMQAIHTAKRRQGSVSFFPCQFSMFFGIILTIFQKEGSEP